MTETVTRAAKGVTIRLTDVEIPASVRPYNAAVVAELAESIRQIGLQSAPTVVERDGRHVLVAGRHRVEALKLLGVSSVICRLVDMDDREARLWAISENLHRAELTALQRAEAIAEYARLATGSDQRAAGGAQVAQHLTNEKGASGREAGDSLVARGLGVARDDVRRARTIAALPAEAKQAAVEGGLGDNQSALLRVAKERAPEAQLRAVETEASAERRAPGPKPLRNLENISGGELARWVKLTTPNDRPHVIQVLETAAAILQDELEAKGAA